MCFSKIFKAFIGPTSIVFVIALVFPFNYSNRPVFTELLSKIVSHENHNSATAAPTQAVEIASLRTANSKTFLNPDGTYTAQISSIPIYFKDPSGQWQNIDASLSTDASGNSYQNGANSFSVDFSKNGQNKDLVKIQDGNLSISFSPENRGNIIPTFKDNSVTYSNILAGTQSDLKYISLATGIKSEIVLKVPGSNIFKFSLSTVGLTPKLLDNGQVVFYDSPGQPRWQIPKAFAYDAKGSQTNDVNYSLVKIDNGYELVIIVDQKWLNDTARVYPVVIDPTVILYSAYGTGDTYIDYLNPYTNYEYSPYLVTGYYNRALIKFDISSIPVKNDILNSYISLLVSAYSLGPSHTYPITTNWVSSQATWYWTGTGGWWNGGSYDTSMGVPLFGNYSAYANVTDIVRKWYTGDSSNYGFIIIRDDDNVGPYYSSAESANPPTLTITYAPWNGIQDRWQYVSFPQGDGQESNVNVANGNLTINHPDWNINSPGMNMVVGRTYNSMPDQTLINLFGQMWTTNIDVRIKTVTLNNSVQFVNYRDQTGTWFSFGTDGAGGWKRPPGLGASLVYDSTWCIKYDNGITYRFGSSSSDQFYLTSIYDRNGRTITINLDYNNRITGVVDTANRSASFSYNGYGSAATITDSASRTTSYSYSYCGGVSAYLLTSFTNQAARQTTYAYDYYGRIISSTDPRGNQTKYNYDANGRISSVIYCEGSTNRDTWTFAYDDYNHTTTVTDPLSHSTTYYWDIHGGTVWKTVDASGNQHTATYNQQYNVLHNIERTGNETDYQYNSSGLLLTSVTQLVPGTNGIVTTYAYNDSNNPFLPTMMTDPEGNSTISSYDTCGKLLSTQFWLGNNTYYSYYEYDAAKKYQIKKFTDPKGNVTNYEYNGSHYELSKVTDPLGKMTTYTYDSLSRMLTKVDAKSQTTSYTYDNLDRVTRIDYQGGSYVTYTYDYNGNLTQMYESTNGTTSYTYDYRNRLTQKTFPDTSTMSYTYNSVGNLTSKTDAGGTISYGYNSVNLLSSVTEPGNYITQYTSYDGSGNLLSMAYPNGDTVTNVWDVANRLTSTETKLGGTTLVKFSYTYTNQLYNRETKTKYTMTDKDNNTTTYTYDKLNELTSAIEKNSQGSTLDSRSWSYNENSNRTQQVINGNTTNYTYDNNNRVLTAGPLSYTWDDNGNLLTRSDGLTLTYNTKDFTATITPPGGSSITMNYSGTDQTQRIQKGTTTYKYDDKGIGPTVESGGSTTYFTTTPFGGLVDLRQGTNRYYYIFDGLGSVVGLTNSSGTMVNTYSYDPFGNILAQTEAVAQPYKFAGVYYDSQTGLYKMGARYYDPTIGRFTQVDPVQLKGGLPIVFNYYIYACNNPINGTDITGRFIPLIVIIVVVLIVVVTIGYTYNELWLTPQNETKSDLQRYNFPTSTPKAHERVPFYFGPTTPINPYLQFGFDAPNPNNGPGLWPNDPELWPND